MNNSTRLASLLFLLLALTGCELPSADDTSPPVDDNDGNVETSTIVDVAIADGRFTILVDAVVSAGLADTLSGEGPFTVFAPTDDAFNALPEGTLDSLSSGELADILLYHVVAGAVDSTAVSSLVTATTLLGAPVNIDSGAGVMVNDASVVVADVAASNGIIHAIDSVLLPPATIADVATSAGSFSTLLQALTDADLAASFADPAQGPFTVFAPTDAAFELLPEGTLESLSIDDLTSILLYHVVDGIVDSQTVSGLTSADTLNGEDISIDASSGVVIDGSSTVTTANIIARNGIIHVVDSVLLPAGL